MIGQEINIGKELRVGLKDYSGAITQVATEAGVTIQMVGMVFRGKRKSQRIIDVASRVLLEKRKEELEKLEVVNQRLKESKNIRQRITALKKDNRRLMTA